MNAVFRLAAALALAAAGTLGHQARADEAHAGHAGRHAAHDHHIGHAPIGVMGGHAHHRGEWMTSYRVMRMGMEGNRVGRRDLDPDAIATTVPNRFFGRPMQPPTLRIVPAEMRMTMHMFGIMHAPTDRLTLMAMLNYVEKEMDNIVYRGGRGTARRGQFTVKTEGIGDTTLAALVKLRDDGRHGIHLNAGLSIPTGATDESHQILTPMGARPTVRVPYAMQLGSGTYDLLPGVTYNGHSERWHWGGQYMATLRTGDADGYALGDRHALTGWLNYQWRPRIDTSARLRYETVDAIDGIDPMIAGPVQTADPDNYGGETLSLFLGASLTAQSGPLAGHRLAVEAGRPLIRDLNGPQMDPGWSLVVGWQFGL